MAEIVKAGPNTATFPLHPWMYEEIVAWERGVAADAAKSATTNRYKNYLSGPFNSWWQNYDAGRAEEPAPNVPEGFDAQMSADGLAFDLVGSGAPCGPPAPFKRRVITQSTPGLLPAGGVAGTWIDPFATVALYGTVNYMGMTFARVK